MQRLLRLGLTTGLLLLAAAPASASTVSVGLNDDGAGPANFEMRYLAAPGEANAATFLTVDDFTVRVTDIGATITAGDRCRSLDAHTAECTIAGIPYDPARSPYLYAVGADLGDGNDTALSHGPKEKAFGPRLLATGGAGDDVLTGSDGKGDVLDGGGGRDRLFGRGNNDDLRDGDTTGAADADLLDGGPAQDTVDYQARSAPVTVKLAVATATQGEAGEGDVARGFESARGGAGDDTLIGGGVLNVLEGGLGDDHLDGHGGVDILTGDAGEDRLHGHDGDDSLRGGAGADELRGDAGFDSVSAPRRNDRLRCGRGGAVLVNTGDRVRVERACTRLGYTFDSQGRRAEEDTSVSVKPYPTRKTATAVTFTVGCPKPDDLDGLCAFDTAQSMRLRDASGRLLGRGSLDRARYRREAGAERGDQNPIRVVLTKRGRRLAARSGGVTATVSLSTLLERDVQAKVSWVITLTT